MAHLLIIVLLLTLLPVVVANEINMVVSFFYALSGIALGVAYAVRYIVAAPFYIIFWLARALYRLPGALYRMPGRLRRLPGAIRRYNYADPGEGVSVLMALGAILLVTLILTPFLPH